jgi:hypothetical protein
VREHVVEQVAPAALPVGRHRAEHPFRDGRDEGIGVDLPVRVGLGHPDLLASVLKTEHLLDVFACAQLARPVDESVQHQVDAAGLQLMEGGVVVSGVTDHLTASGAGAFGEQGSPGAVDQVPDGGLRPYRPGGRPCEGREAVLEHDDLVVMFRYFCQVIVGGRAQRAVLRRREVGPVLAVRCVHDPNPEQRVAAKLR